jgi:hypothetical protein
MPDCQKETESFLNQHRAQRHPEIQAYDPLTGKQVSSISDTSPISPAGATREPYPSKNHDDSSQNVSEERAARSVAGSARSDDAERVQSLLDVPNVYGKLLTHSALSTDDSKQSLLPQMNEISDDYLNTTIRHILCVKPSDPNPVQETLSSVIESVALSHYRIRQESALFQPKWSGFDDPSLMMNATVLRRFLRMLGLPSKHEKKMVWVSCLRAGKASQLSTSSSMCSPSNLYRFSLCLKKPKLRYHFIYYRS